MMRRGRILLMLVFIIILILIGCARSESNDEEMVLETADVASLSKLATINTLADQVYDHAVAGEAEEARAGILQISEQVTSIRYEGITSVEGIEAFTDVIIRAKAEFTAAQYIVNKGIVIAAELKLAVDALLNPDQPMWLQYYKVLKDDGLKLAAALGDEVAEKTQLQQLLDHYGIIRSAVVISREPDEVQKMDSFLTFLQTEPLDSALHHYKEILDELFFRKSSTAYLAVDSNTQLLYSSSVISLFIVSVLTYVGWRKFKGITASNDRQRRRGY